MTSTNHQRRQGAHRILELQDLWAKLFRRYRHIVSTDRRLFTMDWCVWGCSRQLL